MNAETLDSARLRLAFPLDYPDITAAREGATRVGNAAGILKIGLELFVKEGPQAVLLGREFEAQVFLDLKLHDIPQTVENAVASACALGVRYLTLHGLGGPRMIEAARKRVEKENVALTLLAVTVLTSMDSADLLAVGIEHSPSDEVEKLAAMALDAGAAGLVCSPLEVRRLRQRFGAAPVLVTPGIRPAEHQAADDQKRTGTPRQAILDGSSILVVGRPIRDAANPKAAAASICRDIAEALS